MLTTADRLPQALIDHYRANGFVKIPRIISQEEAERFRRACLAHAAVAESNCKDAVFTQHVNAWRLDATIRELTLHPNVAAIAQKLAGVPLRLWHDHCLIKHPHNQVATEFHQDQAYWPHANSVAPISAWIALVDVPPERGCMTFIPNSFRYTELPTQNLRNPRSLFELAPELEWEPRVTLPLQAGDCTFHHGRCAHMAPPNQTDVARVAHVVIYVDAATIVTSGRNHVVTRPLELPPNAPLAGELFPTVEAIVAGQATG